jgi:hypothetical protein
MTETITPEPGVGRRYSFMILEEMVPNGCVGKLYRMVRIDSAHGEHVSADDFDSAVAALVEIAKHECAVNVEYCELHAPSRISRAALTKLGVGWEGK